MITIINGTTAPSLMGRKTKTGDYEVSIKKNGHGSEITLSRDQIKELISDMVVSL